MCEDERFHMPILVAQFYYCSIWIPHAFVYSSIQSLWWIQCSRSNDLSDIQWVQESIQTPLIFHSLLYCSHLLKSFKFIFFLINVHTAPHIDRKTQNCWHFCRFIKKEKLKYHMVLSIQTLCCDIFNSGAVHFFWSSLRWFYTFIWVQLCLIILIGLD